MKLTRREQMMLALLPAILILGIYEGFVGPGLESRTVSAKASVNTALSADIPAGSASDPKVMEAELAKVTQERAAIATRTKELAERWSAPELRAATARELSDLVGRHGLHVESSGPPLSGDRRTSESASTAGLARSLKELGGAEPMVWRVRATGSWDAIVATLTAVSSFSKDDRFALPLSFSLEPTGMSGDLELSLVMWI